MKKMLLFVILILFVVSNSFAQFSASVGIGPGLNLSNSEQEFNYQWGLNVLPSFTFNDEWNVGVQSYTVFPNTSELPSIFTGVKLSYLLLNNDNHPLNVSARWLYASGGETLVGGGLNYSVNDRVNIGLDLGSRYGVEQNEFMGELNLNYNLVK